MSAKRQAVCKRCSGNPLLHCAVCFPDEERDVSPGFSEIGEAQDELLDLYPDWGWPEAGAR